MLRKIITVVLFALIAISSSFALTNEADTVWTRNLGFSAIRLDFVQNDEFIIVSGSNGVYRIRASDGKVVNEYEKFTSLYGFNQDKTKLIFSNDFSIFTMDFDTEIISDSIVIEKTNEFQYVDGDTTNPWDESYLLAPLTSPDGKYILCSWFRSGYRFNSYEPEFIETRTIIIINKETKKIEKEIELVPNAKCFSPDGNYLAIGKSGDEGIVELYSAKTFEYIKRIANLNNTIKKIEFSHDSNLLAVLLNSSLECLYIYDVNTKECINKKDNSIYEKYLNIEFLNNLNKILIGFGNSINAIGGFKQFDIDKDTIISLIENKVIYHDYLEIFFDISKDNKLLITSSLDFTINPHLLGVSLVRLNINSDIIEKKENQAIEVNILDITNKTISILINTEKQQFVSMSIYDITGNKIKDVYNKSLAESISEIKIDISDLATGLYFLNIETEDCNNSYKFIKE